MKALERWPQGLVLRPCAVKQPVKQRAAVSGKPRAAPPRRRGAGATARPRGQVGFDTTECVHPPLRAGGEERGGFTENLNRVLSYTAVPPGSWPGLILGAWTTESKWLWRRSPNCGSPLLPPSDLGIPGTPAATREDTYQPGETSTCCEEPKPPSWPSRKRLPRPGRPSDRPALAEPHGRLPGRPRQHHLRSH